ncbi:unnamed protein product, partial [marine sediment metagenome]
FHYMSNIFQYLNPWYYFKKYPTLGEFVRFAIVGAINTGIDFGIFYVLTEYVGWDKEKGIAFVVLAHAISFTAAVINSYILNKYWTFKSKGGDISKQFTKFLIVSIIGLILSSIILSVLVKYFDFHELTGKLAAIVVVLFWNYLANKFWTFRSKKQENIKK